MLFVQWNLESTTLGPEQKYSSSSGFRLDETFAFLPTCHPPPIEMQSRCYTPGVISPPPSFLACPPPADVTSPHGCLCGQFSSRSSLATLKQQQRYHQISFNPTLCSNNPKTQNSLPSSICHLGHPVFVPCTVPWLKAHEASFECANTVAALDVSSNFKYNDVQQ